MPDAATTDGVVDLRGRGPQTVAIHLGGDRADASLARSFVASSVSAWGRESPQTPLAPVYDLQLVASELVGEALARGRRPERLVLTDEGGATVLVEVFCEGRAPFDINLDGTDRQRIHLVVEKLSVRWGSEPSASGRRLWARMQNPATPVPDQPGPAGTPGPGRG
jgi:hypothetical protein